MTDEQLRELERRWQATRAIADEVALLRERIRSGDVTEESIELAAYCGGAAARQIVTPPAIVPYRHAVPPSDLAYGFLDGLERWGLEAVVRAAAELAIIALPVWERSYADPRPREALRAAEAWLACPCDTHAQLATAASAAALAAGCAISPGTMDPALVPEDEAWTPVVPCYGASAAEFTARLPSKTVRNATLLLPLVFGSAVRALGESKSVVHQLQRTVADALVTWAQRPGGRTDHGRRTSPRSR